MVATAAWCRVTTIFCDEINKSTNAREMMFSQLGCYQLQYDDEREIIVACVFVSCFDDGGGRRREDA